MKLTKNLVSMMNSLSTRYSIKKIYMQPNIRIDVAPLRLFAHVRVLMDHPHARNLKFGTLVHTRV